MKSIFYSRTFWVNLIAIIAMCLQIGAEKEVLDLKAQASVLAAINIILRVITKKQIVWK